MSPTALATRGEQKKPIQKRENNVLVEGVLKGILASEKAGNTVCLLVALEIIATLFRYLAYSHLGHEFIFYHLFHVFFALLQGVFYKASLEWPKPARSAAASSLEQGLRAAAHA